LDRGVAVADVVANGSDCVLAVNGLASNVALESVNFIAEVALDGLQVVDSLRTAAVAIGHGHNLPKISV
jgi:hypothetical protein